MPRPGIQYCRHYYHHYVQANRPILGNVPNRLIAKTPRILTLPRFCLPGKCALKGNNRTSTMGIRFKRRTIEYAWGDLHLSSRVGFPIRHLKLDQAHGRRCDDHYECESERIRSVGGGGEIMQMTQSSHFTGTVYVSVSLSHLPGENNDQEEICRLPPPPRFFIRMW